MPIRLLAKRAALRSASWQQMLPAQTPRTILLAAKRRKRSKEDATICVAPIGAVGIGFASGITKHKVTHPGHKPALSAARRIPKIGVNGRFSRFKLMAITFIDENQRRHFSTLRTWSIDQLRIAQAPDQETRPFRREIPAVANPAWETSAATMGALAIPAGTLRAYVPFCGHLVRATRIAAMLRRALLEGNWIFRGLGRVGVNKKG